MEINVGEYVRTKCGIAKLNRIDNGYQYFLDSDIYDEDTLENTCVTYIKYITKHSKDIIDLIEVGDYVNGEYTDLFNLDYYKKHPEHIKSILTHEQFEANAYTIEKEV
jgi:hypothetical protein